MEYSLEVRDTKRGMEELTADIPNVSERSYVNWMKMESFIVGAEVGRRYPHWKNYP